MSKNVLGADNQQGSPLIQNLLDYDPSETTRRAPFLSKEEMRAYLQGALHDATKGRGSRIRYTQKYRLWLQVLSYFLDQLGHSSWMYREGKKREVYALETTASFLDFSFDPRNYSSAREIRGYIRGFFDAEGGVPHKKENRFYIQFVQKDKLKLGTLKLLLKDLKIDTGVIHNPSKKVDPHYWRFFISTRSHLTFAQTIGSHHPVKRKIFKERMVI